MSERDDINLTPEEEQQVRESLHALGEVRADEAFRSRLREQFVAGAIPASGVADLSADAADAAEADPAPIPVPASPPLVFPDPPRRPRRPWALAAVPAMAAILAVVIFTGGGPDWRLQDVRGAGTVVVAGETATIDAPDDLARLVRGGATYEVPAGAEIDLALGDIMVVGAAGPTRFTLRDVADDRPRRFEVHVDEGEFRFKSGPGFPGHEMVISTSEGDAVVTGTTVAVYKDAEVTCVCVLEGTVMIGTEGQDMDPVPAGMRKVMFADGREPLVIAIEPGHRDGLVDFEHHNEHTFAE